MSSYGANVPEVIVEAVEVGGLSKVSEHLAESMYMTFNLL